LLTVLWFGLACLPGVAQTTAVTGKVTAADDGAALPGVTVLEKGTTNGTSTDAQGNYRLSVAGNATLVFSFIGFTTEEAGVGGRSTLDVTLAPDVKALNEVVVTGYGTQERRKLTGSAATVTNRSIEQVPLASFDQILQGQAPGLLIQSGGGQPGQAASVIIRGRGSISGGSDPLYVLDGVPISPGDFAALNPNDFESVNVLKDAAATSIYGSRGANGVIVITTKKGKAGKTQFNYNFQIGGSELPRSRSRLTNSNEKIDLELATGIGLVNTMDEAEIARLRQINTDWSREIFHRGTTTSHELTASGGNENTQFFTSFNYFKQEGTLRNTGLDRYTGRLNLSNTSGNFTFGTNLTLGYARSNYTSETNAGIGSPLNAFRWANPYETPRDSAGNYSEIMSGQPNPVQELEQSRRAFGDIKAVGNVYLQYNVPLLPGLSVRTNWGVDFRQREQQIYFDRNSYAGSLARGGQGSLATDNSRAARFIGTNSVTYARDFGSHSLEASVFNELIYQDSVITGFTGYGITGKIKTTAGITPGVQDPSSPNYIPATRGATASNALVSYFTNVNYGFKNRYFLSVGLRRDGSSRFGANNRFANFYSVGAGWLLSDEDFLGFAKGFLSNLKLRGSFGTVGNQEGIGNFSARALYAARSYNGEQGIAQISLGDPNLRWEVQQKLNLGVDLGVFNNRIGLSVDFYDNITKDLFLPVELSRTTGFNSLLQNVGKLRNRGVEVALNTVNVRAGGFEWTSNLNFTYNRNRVLDLFQQDTVIDINNVSITAEGLPLNTNWVVPYVGVNPANGEALYLDREGNVTNQYSANYARAFGTRDAPYFGGFGNTFSYKGVSLSVLLVYVYGNQFYNNERTNIDNPAYILDNVGADLLRAWKKPGDVTDVPAITNPYFSNTTRYLEDASFLRVRNIMLAYSLPASLINRAKLRSVRVFAQGQNLFTATRFLGYDPENNSGVVTGAKYPTLRQVTFGLNLGL
jgi:TonB-linked SusC/RagA family outer membrane protein